MSVLPTSPSTQLRALRDLNTDDLLKAAGLVGLARRWPGLRRVCDGPSLVLARALAAFDAEVGHGRGAEAARALLEGWGTQITLSGSVPLSGPRLFVSNHPGLGDVLALLATLRVPGLKIVARDRPFLRALPELARWLILVPESGSWSVLRRVSDHLVAGGSVLTFPAGRIEPDPAWSDAPFPRAWSPSTGRWARTVPGLVVQPVVVAGVRARGFVDPWAARWRRNLDDRDWTAAVLQLVNQVLWSRPRSVRIDVALGPSLPGDLFRRGEGERVLTEALDSLARSVRRCR